MLDDTVDIEHTSSPTVGLCVMLKLTVTSEVTVSYGEGVLYGAKREG